MVTIKRNTLISICNKIREKLGIDKKYNSLEIPEGIEYVFNAGVKSAYDEFWDNFQQNGNRTIYSCSFGSGWKAENFKPKYFLHNESILSSFFGVINSFPYL